LKGQVIAMDFWQMFTAVGWLCCCVGMVQQQQQGKDDWKRNFNIAYSLFLWHSRALLVPFRRNWGAQALGFPSLFALGLMLLWWMATHDNFMLLWIGFWLLMQLKRRIEAVRLSGQVHSQYDGLPMILRSKERFAKLFLEPLLIGIIGWKLFDFYTENGWRPTGLPYFFLTGIVSLPFVELVHRTIWNRKLQSMSDARIEGKALMHEYRNRFGD
jgi:hypothetical protein